MAMLQSQRLLCVCVLLLPLLPACDDVESPGVELRSEDDETLPEPTIEVHTHLGNRVFARSTASDQVMGPVSLKTQHAMTRLLRALRREGLVELPKCLEHYLPDAAGQTGKDPIPLHWFRGMSGSPSAGYVVEVPAEPECEGIVPPSDPGNIDPHPDQVGSKFDATVCEETEVGGHSALMCSLLEWIEADVDPRHIYPVPDDAHPTGNVFESEFIQNCNTFACWVSDLTIYPLDPAIDDATTAVDVDCETVPEACELQVQIIDRNDLLMGRNEDDKEVAVDGASEECQERINAYNAGDRECDPGVSVCSADGNCYQETDDGYVECNSDSASTECTTCHGQSDSGCESYEVKSRDTDDGSDVYDRERADEEFQRNYEADTGAPPNMTDSGFDEEGVWDAEIGKGECGASAMGRNSDEKTITIFYKCR